MRNSRECNFTGVYFITGITGFVGSLLTKALINTSAYAENQIQILGIIRDEKKAEKIFGEEDCSNLQFIKSDISNYEQFYKNCVKWLDEFREKPIYIIHCASTTKSADMIANPVETADGIVLGTRNVLELARKLQAKSMVYLSSMEVYGNISDNGNGKYITEDQLGDIDILSARSCYPLGKRMAEQYCYSYYKEYGVPVKIARLAQTFGTGILTGENRVFAQFANAVRKNKDIILHTAGNSRGNYCESVDVVNALFTLLHKGENGEAYNVVNESNTMCIREMAELVVDKIAGGRIKVVYDISEGNRYGYASDTGLRLSSAKLRTLGWKPIKSMEEMYHEMIDWMNRKGI